MKNIRKLLSLRNLRYITGGIAVILLITNRFVHIPENLYTTLLWICAGGSIVSAFVNKLESQ